MPNPEKKLSGARIHGYDGLYADRYGAAYWSLDGLGDQVYWVYL